MERTTHCWPDLVLHVLAHVRPLAPLPASLYDRGYVAFVREALGPAEQRALGNDALELPRLLTDHATCARVQMLCRLFEDVAHARACERLELRALAPEHVDRPELLAPLLRDEAVVEVLRCAALLEAERYLELPPAPEPRAALRSAIEDLRAVAPALSRLELRSLRALGWHGRLWHDQIWVGVPELIGVPLEHVAWQAAHEAVLHEAKHAADRSSAVLAERSLEAVALAVLAQRSARAGLHAAHTRWLEHWLVDATQPIAELQSDEQALFERLLDP